jgi:hypothetical protein
VKNSLFEKAFSTVSGTVAPFLVSISIFGTYTLLGYSLTPSKAFACLSLMTILSKPLHNLPKDVIL